MLRIRCDGSALNLEQLRTMAQISTEFARDTADISDRENLQIHWVEVEHVPEIWRRLEAWACRPPRRAVTPRASCSARR